MFKTQQETSSTMFIFSSHIQWKLHNSNSQGDQNRSNYGAFELWSFSSIQGIFTVPQHLFELRSSSNYGASTVYIRFFSRSDCDPETSHADNFHRGNSHPKRQYR